MRAPLGHKKEQTVPGKRKGVHIREGSLESSYHIKVTQFRAVKIRSLSALFLVFTKLMWWKNSKTWSISYYHNIARFTNTDVAIHYKVEFSELSELWTGKFILYMVA